MLAALLVVRPAAERSPDALKAGTNHGRSRDARTAGDGGTGSGSPASAAFDGLRLAWSVPVLRAALLVGRGRRGRRPGMVAAVGLLVAALGVIMLAAGRTPSPAVLAGVLVGVGSGCFATHVGPLVLAATPLTHLARVQSVLVLVQSLPLLVTANAFGLVAEATDVAAVLYGCAGVLAVTGLTALAVPTLHRSSGSSAPAGVRRPNI